MPNAVHVKLPPYPPAFQAQLDDLKQVIGSAKRIATLSHLNPDGDTLGSALALGLGLRKLGKTVKVKCVDTVPKVFRFLPGWEEVDQAKEPCSNYDHVMLCDTASFGRTGGVIEGHSNLIVVDHHKTNDLFGKHNLIDPTASATGVVVYRLLMELGVELDKAIATNLYVAINTDTGTFRYSNTDPETFAICAHLFQCGLNAEEINLAVFESYTEGRQRLMGRMLAGMEALDGGKVYLMTCTKKDFAETGTTAEDLDEVVGEARNVSTARAAVLLREDGPDVWKVSLRAKGGLDIHEVALAYGGGGHAKAAGATMKMSYEEARRLVLEKLLRTMRDQGY